MQDIWGHITKFIKQDKYKCYLMMTCKWISKCNFYFNNSIDIDEIVGIKWFDHFTTVIIRDIVPLPLCVNNLIILGPEKDINTYSELIYRWIFKESTKSIPSSITHLTFGPKFNYPINDLIPFSVTHLTFGIKFNQPINECIPTSVTHLIFDLGFNQSVNGCIPSSVIELVFGNRFNQPINGCIPSLVERVIFGHNFDQSIENCFPSTIKELTFGWNYDHPRNGSIPSTITHLTFERYYNHLDHNRIPSSVKYLTIKNAFEDHYNRYIPSTVTHLIFGIYFCDTVKDWIPSTVTHLSLTNEYDTIKNVVPFGIINLTFNRPLEYSIDQLDYLPLSILKLTFHGHYSNKKIKRICKRLEERNIEIEFPDKFKK